MYLISHIDNQKDDDDCLLMNFFGIFKIYKRIFKVLARLQFYNIV